MDSTTRFIVALLLLLAIQILLGSTSVFLIRRWKRIEPTWSWATSLGAVFLLGLLVTGVDLVPVVGPFAAVIVSLVGLKRLSGLEVISTFILSFCMGISVFIVAAVLSRQFEVNLLGLGR